MSRGKKTVALLVLGFVATAICAALFAGVYVLGESTTARIVDHRVTGGGSDRSCQPILEYRVGGESFREGARVHGGYCPGIGETLEVFFWPTRPDRPSPLLFGALWPLLFAVSPFGAAAWVWMRPAKGAELMQEAIEASVAGARDGARIKLRGRLAIAPETAALAAPLTSRSCVAAWTRVVRREHGKSDQKVQDDKRWQAFIIVAEDGEARVAADTPLKLSIDADARGDTETEECADLEGLLAEHGHSIAALEWGSFYVWYQGLFAPGDEVVAVGKVKRLGPSAIALEGTEREAVVLEHADREARKRSMPKA